MVATSSVFNVLTVAEGLTGRNVHLFFLFIYLFSLEGICFTKDAISMPAGTLSFRHIYAHRCASLYAVMHTTSSVTFANT